ncbi:hypothetical protein [Caulobacter hibisci]|uniref:Uncharacterized protein n=1 Tax=Caulobacter hibisci TaxID=2035993 RepID=A0ABS0SXB3_9CAUL|nr:hypothetical protein [Caulobacter hibisci]MBI1684280.1 hypothetical protein [Caulobacter hibisci]
MFHAIDSTVAFTALNRDQQAAIWSSFFEAVDGGCAGHHPLYEVLAPLYAAGDYPSEAALACLILVEVEDLALAADLDAEPPF